MITLLNQYKNAREELKDMIAALEPIKTDRDDEDRKLLNSMIGSTTKIIEWLETGRNPYYEQGIDKRHAYHIKYLSNMDILPDINEQITSEREPLFLTSDEKRIIVKIFKVLSDRERDCFILHEAKGLSMSQVGNKLGIAKTTVQNHVENARIKIENVKHGTNMVRSHY